VCEVEVKKICRESRIHAVWIDFPLVVHVVLSMSMR
jgi:hypothetical protein